MGLRIKRGPAWHNDAFGYINSNVSEMNIRERHYEIGTVSDDDLMDKGMDSKEIKRLLGRNNEI